MALTSLRARHLAIDGDFHPGEPPRGRRGLRPGPRLRLLSELLGNSNYRRPAKDPESVSPLTFALGAALLALAAFGLAYFRSKVAR